MVTVSSNPNPTYPTNPTNPTNPTTKYRCELDMCCLTWYKNLGPPFTGMPLFNSIPDTNHNANPTNPNCNSKGNPNPTNPTNPNTRYRCE